MKKDEAPWDEFLSHAKQLKTDDVAVVVMRIGRGWEFTYMEYFHLSIWWGYG